MPKAATIPSRRPPRAALAMTKVMSAPGTMLSASPATTKLRKAGQAGSNSIPPISSIGA